MAKKTGLGKGLDALFGGDLINEEIEEKEEIKDGEKITKIKLTEIEPNRNQPRIIRRTCKFNKRIWINTTNCFS